MPELHELKEAPAAEDGRVAGLPAIMRVPA